MASQQCAAIRPLATLRPHSAPHAVALRTCRTPARGSAAQHLAAQMGTAAPRTSSCRICSLRALSIGMPLQRTWRGTRWRACALPALPHALCTAAEPMIAQMCCNLQHRAGQTAQYVASPLRHMPLYMCAHVNSPPLVASAYELA